jgi:hypothetical protein
MGKTKKAVLLGFAGFLVAVAAIHNVGTAVTDEDRFYGAQILERAGYDAAPETFGDLNVFDNQIAAILAVQDAVLKATPIEKELAHGRSREPKDVLTEGMGICFDRSRTMEKILTSLGFENRHLAIYSTREHGTLRALMTPGTASHALTEVKTSKGWILVDSNARWIGLDPQRNVHSVDDIQNQDPFATVWATEVPEPVSWRLFNQPFTYVIGLYSRHGGFFPPVTPVPDVNYRQLLQNIY